jgi:hypothetical protein
MQHLALTQGPSHHEPARSRQLPGVVLTHYHQIDPDGEPQWPQCGPQGLHHALPILRRQPRLGHHHQQIIDARSA